MSTAVVYTFHANGAVATRQWERVLPSTSTPVTTTYGYDTLGHLASVSYNDGTAGSTFTYNNGGRLLTRARNSLTETVAYTAGGQVDTETFSGTGPQAGFVVDRNYDAYGRLSTLDVKLSGTAYTPQVTYTWAGADLLSTISATSGGSSKTATYANAANMSTRSLSYTVGTTGVLTGGRSVDSAGRPYLVAWQDGSTMLQSFTHTYNADGSVKDITREDSAQWQYGYDLKGQVTEAKKQLPGSTTEWYRGTVAQYDYDHAGNRKTAKESGGGTVSGSNFTWATLTSTYTADAHNKYTTVASPQDFDVTGKRASTGNTVTVTTSSAGAQTLASTDYQPSGSTYYAKRITHNAGTYGLYDSVTVAEDNQPNDTGVEYTPPQTITTTPPVTTPPTPPSLTYDADGNLTYDGRWNYTWDGENRLIAQECAYSATPAVNGQKITYLYDALSRRIRKTVEHKTSASGSWVWQRAEAYLYDGWNMIMTLELNSSTALVRRTASYVWGPDISSRATARSNWQQAGGVGGLVFIIGNQSSLASTHPGYHDYAPLIDRMGNITALRKLATGQGSTLEALYDYDAFGNPTRMSGAAAKMNPFRFSSKFTDDETGLVYYGYRYYWTDAGRWISRDPIGEKGGINLQVTLRNDDLNTTDYLGLDINPLDPRWNQRGFNCARCHMDTKLLDDGFGLGNPDFRGGNPYRGLTNVTKFFRGGVEDKIDEEILDNAVCRDGARIMHLDINSIIFHNFDPSEIEEKEKNNAMSSLCITGKYSNKFHRTVQTSHVWGIGRMTVDISIELRVNHYQSNASAQEQDVITYSGAMVMQGRSNHFDFTPWPNNRGFAAETMTLMGYVQQKAGWICKVEIYFTGSVVSRIRGKMCCPYANKNVKIYKNWTD